MVEATEGVGAESVIRGTEVMVNVIMGGEVGGAGGATLGSGTGYFRVMVSINWPNLSWRLVIASSWVLKVTAGASVISHVRVYMPWIIRSSEVIEYW